VALYACRHTWRTLLIHVYPGKAKRQGSTGPGPTLDGSAGVDSQDISNSPNIGYAPFSMFPDFTPLATNGVAPTNFNDLVQLGIDYIEMQASSAQAYVPWAYHMVIAY